MGASWSIEAHSEAEFLALESEGSPSVHLTYGSSGRVFEAAGFVPDYDSCWFDIPADRAAEAAILLRVAAVLDSDFWQASAVAEVLEAAVQLGRGVTAA